MIEPEHVKTLTNVTIKRLYFSELDLLRIKISFIKLNVLMAKLLTLFFIIELRFAETF